MGRRLQRGALRRRAAAGGGGGGNPATVTLADGSKLEGTLVRKDDFLVVLTLPDGTRKSIARTQRRSEGRGQGSAETRTRTIVLKLDDPENKKMHDVTAYCGRSSRGATTMKKLLLPRCSSAVWRSSCRPGDARGRLLGPAIRLDGPTVQSGPAPPTTGGLDPADIMKPLADEWTSYSGDLSGKRYSALKLVNTDTVKNLSLKWITPLTTGCGPTARRRRAARRRPAAGGGGGGRGGGGGGGNALQSSSAASATATRTTAARRASAAAS